MANQPDLKRVFAENYVGCIATVNEDGSPWITPLHMGIDDRAEYVYWFSEEKEQHCCNHERDDRVSLAIFAPAGGPHKEGIYLNGRVEKVDESLRQEIRELLEKRLNFTLATFDVGTAYRMSIGTYNEQRSTGNCWYFYG